MYPTTPQAEAGILIEPPISLPVAKVVQPEANVAALPPLDPPGVMSKFHGFLVTPLTSEWQKDVRENSGFVVRPCIIAPELTNDSTSISVLSAI